MSPRRLSTELSLHSLLHLATIGGRLGGMPSLNGAPVSLDQVQTLALVNYGHFTSMRVDHKHVRGLSHHLDRLVGDSRLLFNSELDRDMVRTLVRDEVATTELDSFVVRVTVFNPSVDLGHPSAGGNLSVLVTTRPAGPKYPDPIRVQTVAYMRDLPKVKHVGLLGAMWHRRSVQLNGYDDALFIDRASFISEGATWNVGFYDGERIVWPNSEVLPGVTMRLLQQVHDKSVSMPVSLRDCPMMIAAFATNTSIGVRPIAEIDGVRFKVNHEIFDVLRKEYEEIPPERI